MGGADEACVVMCFCVFPSLVTLKVAPLRSFDHSFSADNIFFENLSDGRYWYFENDSAVDFLYKLIVNLSAENTAVEPEELKAFQRVLDIAIDCKLQMIIYFFS